MVEMTPRQFLNRLKQAGISQRCFARWFGFDVGTVNRWARGRALIPQYAAEIVDILAEHPEIKPKKLKKGV